MNLASVVALVVQIDSLCCSVLLLQSQLLLLTCSANMSEAEESMKNEIDASSALKSEETVKVEVSPSKKQKTSLWSKPSQTSQSGFGAFAPPCGWNR